MKVSKGSIRCSKVIHGSYDQRKIKEVKLPGAKLNKDAEKILNHCMQTVHSCSKFFSARFARILLVPSLLHLFHHPCF